jgi:hypothetical protein
LAKDMHPSNKRDRIIKGKKKGKKRASLLLIGNTNKKIRLRLERLHRDTTKLCGGVCCGNPRKYLKEITIQEQKAELDKEI